MLGILTVLDRFIEQADALLNRKEREILA